MAYKKQWSKKALSNLERYCASTVFERQKKERGGGEERKEGRRQRKFIKGEWERKNKSGGEGEYCLRKNCNLTKVVLKHKY